MSKTTENNDLNLPKEIQVLSDRIVKDLAAPDKEGTIEENKTVYEATLPDGITMEQVIAIQKHDKNFVVASAHAVGVVGQKFAEKHPKVAHVHLEKLHMGHNHLRVNYAREATVPGLGGKATTHNGYLTAKLTTAAGATSGAAFKRVRTHFQTEGAKLFGGAK